MKLLLAAILFVAPVLALSACSSSKETLNIFTWSDNFNPESIEKFEKEFDVKVNLAYYGSNEEMYEQIRSGGTSYDLIQPSDYMLTTMIKQEMVEKINFDNVPNIKNINEKFLKPAYDPTGEYSVVYMTGVTGIAYNTKHVKEVPDSWDDLWNPKYKGRVVLLDDVREIMGMSLIKNELNNNSTNKKELEVAYADLTKLYPNVMAFDTNNIKPKFVGEEAWIGTVWSGDAAFIAADNPDISYVVPKEGASIFADTMAIPKGSKKKELAEKFINFMLDAENSAENYEYVGYSNPNEAAKEFHSKKYLDNKMINLSDEDLAKTKWIVDVGDSTPLYDEFWTRLKSGGK
ncbi:MAG: ABC transporter substrate-binding protein [Bacilli bacterium]